MLFYELMVVLVVVCAIACTPVVGCERPEESLDRLEGLIGREIQDYDVDYALDYLQLEVIRSDPGVKEAIEQLEELLKFNNCSLKTLESLLTVGLRSLHNFKNRPIVNGMIRHHGPAALNRCWPFIDETILELYNSSTKIQGKLEPVVEGELFAYNWTHAVTESMGYDTRTLAKLMRQVGRGDPLNVYGRRDFNYLSQKLESYVLRSNFEHIILNHVMRPCVDYVDLFQKYVWPSYWIGRLAESQLTNEHFKKMFIFNWDRREELLKRLSSEDLDPTYAKHQ